jgi:hypothetical protein
MLPVGNPTYIGQYVRRWKLWLLSVCGKRLRVGHSSGPSTSLRITREHQHPEPKQHESARGGLRCRRGGGCTGSFGVCPKGKREFAIAGLYKLLLAWLDESSTVTQET